MSAHVTRLENYVSSMHALQKLEDVDIKTSVIDCEEFAKQIRDCADILCREKGMALKFTTHFKCSKSQWIGNWYCRFLKILFLMVYAMEKGIGCAVVCLWGVLFRSSGR